MRVENACRSAFTVVDMNWPKYVAKISSNAQQKDIARAAGVDGSTVSRWKSGLAPKPENVAAFARSYRRPVLEAFVAAGYLTPEEANEQPTARPSLTDLSSDELIHEIARRLKAGEQGERDTSPMNQAGDGPADDWPHFDPDERTETVTHLRARGDLERIDTATDEDLRQKAAFKGHKRGRAAKAAQDQAAEEPDDRD